MPETTSPGCAQFRQTSASRNAQCNHSLLLSLQALAESQLVQEAAGP